ncbi:hypothetical protein CDIK_4067 [Cucumispora dikerogammari]|nr:hypothetical protein CDIK_4067 [Cucumispora dikerogammari]
MNITFTLETVDDFFKRPIEDKISFWEEFKVVIFNNNNDTDIEEVKLMNTKLKNQSYSNAIINIDLLRGFKSSNVNREKDRLSKEYDADYTLNPIKYTSAINTTKTKVGHINTVSEPNDEYMCLVFDSNGEPKLIKYWEQSYLERILSWGDMQMSGLDMIFYIVKLFF